MTAATLCDMEKAPPETARVQAGNHLVGAIRLDRLVPGPRKAQRPYQVPFAPDGPTSWPIGSTPAPGLGLWAGGPLAVGCAIISGHKSSLPRMKHSIRRSAEVCIAQQTERLADFKAPGGIGDRRNAH
jgi:hypothetical protein